MKKYNKLNGIRTLLAICTVSVIAALPASGTYAFDLVTLEEHNEAVEAGDNPAHDLVAKSIPGGPQIKIVSPEVTSDTLASPVDIEVQFQSSEGANIDMDSLKIYYLMFIKKDVTKRILENADVGTDSLKASGAKLPSGKHKFLVEISDSEKRKSSEKFIVEVDS